MRGGSFIPYIANTELLLSELLTTLAAIETFIVVVLARNFNDRAKQVGVAVITQSVDL